MTQPSSDAALAAVAAAYAHVDLDALPDPPLPWWTSSVSEAHPGKKFHATSFCRRLDKVKHVQATTRTYSDVGTRVCGECLADHDVDQRRLGRATWTARTVAADLNAAAALESTDALHRLEALERRVRGPHSTGTAEHDDAAKAAASAYNRLRRLLAQTTAAGEPGRARERAAAVMLLAGTQGPMPGSEPKFDRPPATTTNLKLLGGRQGKGGTWTAVSLGRPFTAFRDAIDAGSTAAEAREAAAEKLPSLSQPHDVTQLPEEIPVPPGSATVSVTHLIEVWRGHAAELAEHVLDEWVAAVETLVARYADLGTLTVTISTRNNKWAVDREVKKFTAVYGDALLPGSTAKTIMVPAVVAAWLERFTAAHKVTCSLGSHGENTLEVLAAVDRLRADNPGLDLADALVAARGIVAAAA